LPINAHVDVGEREVRILMLTMTPIEFIRLKIERLPDFKAPRPSLNGLVTRQLRKVPVNPTGCFYE
jgi:hypothetical protein